MRKAIDGLVDEGLLVRRQGSGNFVCARIEKNFAKLTSFSEDMRARGRTPRSAWLQALRGHRRRRRKRSTLRLSPGTPVYRFHRLRYADDAPMALEYATIVASALPSLEAVDTSLYEALERSGPPPGARAAAAARGAAERGAGASCCKAKAAMPGLLVERLGLLRDGRAIEFSQSYYRGDTYDFVAELSTSTERRRTSGADPRDPAAANRPACSARPPSAADGGARAARARTPARARRSARRCARSRRAPWSPARAAARTTRRPTRNT